MIGFSKTVTISNRLLKRWTPIRYRVIQQYRTRFFAEFRRIMPTEKNTSITRRRMLQGAGGVIAAAAFPGWITAASVSQKAASDITGRLARYMVEARDRNLPPEVVRACKHRI